ncbi:universal stress protein [Halogeometricum limi]|uniref:Nucleotide-binding universal stress protein, UspA family n=1 Tax=Halogeometricum limi TaxID=555875 RepID=A0A1I6FZA9_9EURY|nr:universal stress protein [Halogeometricum limi]SFR35295.1 Nucleotide-binding universal stress protein, UspA family [Halogeometricum limi]
MYENILFLTDGSDESLQALNDAVDIASQYDATLHALYVVDTDRSDAGLEDGPMDLTPIFEALRDQGEKAIRRARDAAEDAGVSVVESVRDAPVVHRAVNDYVAENDVDLVVMATHGRRGLDRLLLGSVTERVVRTADVPVLTVRGKPTPAE